MGNAASQLALAGQGEAILAFTAVAGLVAVYWLLSSLR